MSVPRLSQDIFEILYKSDVGIAICDGEGRFVWGNPQYQRISKFEVHKVEGQHILDIMTAHSVNVQGAENMLSVVLNKRSSYTCMVDFNTGHDTIATATPIFNEDGSLRWLMYYLVDCDQVFQMQQQLAEVTERMEVSQKQLQEALFEKGGLNSSVVHDGKMLDIYAAALRMAQVTATVLILGETGTGKDHLAKFIHNAGTRKENPFVHVNCSAIPENLFESELFGYEAGSFTGASRQGKMGLIEFANHGTLYLDEVADLPLNMQTKLLLVLQNKKLIRIGGVKARAVDVRVIAATNRDLQSMVAEKRFREDLYYRLNVLEIQLPPLRDRRDDIIPFVQFFVERFNERYKMHKKFSQHALHCFLQYDWPGNVRELEHLVERLVIMSPEDFIGEELLPEKFRNAEKKTPSLEKGRKLKDILEMVEEQVLRKAIASSSSLKEAAERLGIELSTLTRKKQKYGIYLKKEYGERENEE